MRRVDQAIENMNIENHNNRDDMHSFVSFIRKEQKKNTREKEQLIFSFDQICFQDLKLNKRRRRVFRLNDEDL